MVFSSTAIHFFSFLETFKEVLMLNQHHGWARSFQQYPSLLKFSKLISWVGKMFTKFVVLKVHIDDGYCQSSKKDILDKDIHLARSSQDNKEFSIVKMINSSSNTNASKLTNKGKTSCNIPKRPSRVFSLTRSIYSCS